MPEETLYAAATAHRHLEDVGFGKPPHPEVVRPAAVQLCQEFVKLMEEYGLNVKREEPGDSAFRCMLSTTPHFNTLSVIWLVADRDGAIVFLQGHNRAPVHLRYSRRWKRLEGRETDPNVVPVPGDVPPRRAALEVMVHVIRGLTSGK